MWLLSPFTRWGRFLLVAAISSVSICNVVRAEPITIGTISADPVSEARTFKPFSDYLAGQLAADGVETVDIKIALNITDAAKMLKAKEIDFFVDSSVTASIVNNLSGSKFLLRRWKKARGKYRSVIFVNADSAIEGLPELRGKIIAFEEPFSTSGYILPGVALLRSGLKMARLKTFRSKSPADKVGYVMANDNETQMAWLERDIVAAAAMSENDFNDFSKSALKPLRILHTTPYVPYHVISYRADLEQRIVDRMRELLLSAHETDAGKQSFDKFERTLKFDKIPEALLFEIKEITPFLSNLQSNQ